MELVPLESSMMRMLWIWRLNQPVGLRSEPLQRFEDQEWWYEDRHRDSWYGAVADKDAVYSVVGLTDIHHQNGTAELSCITAPNEDDQVWDASIDILIGVAFNWHRLNSVYAEVYMCSENKEHWHRAAERGCANGWDVDAVEIPARKFHAGEYWPATLITWVYRPRVLL